MIYLFNHGGSENHGCEAIVRSTVNLVNGVEALFSYFKEQDTKYGIDEICQIISDTDSTISRGSREWLLSSVQIKLKKKQDLLYKYLKKKLLTYAQKDSVFLSIGGDNYCYAGVDRLIAINNNIRKKGAKTVLWGCSVEPELTIQPAIAKDLAAYNLIVARESISYEALKRVNPNTIVTPDPAFTLEKKLIPLPNNWNEGNMIGINVSPLILQSANSGELAFDAYRQLIREILNSTDCGIALIPHVVWENNDDRVPLKQLYDEFKESGRVVMIDDHNCMELKGYIARCRMFIGARTHATIAAYSSCVPTLVLGYSVKSRGIAKDIFGTYENYVIPVQELQDEYELANAFKWLIKNESDIRNHLQSFMPEYINRAYLAKDALQELCEDK